jgi:hypothetical protein
MHKTCKTSTQKNMEYDGMSGGHGKPRWSMTSNDVIHVEVKEGW